MISVNTCVSIFVQFFCILTPFFVLSMFITMTSGMPARKQKLIAIKTTLAILGICMCIYFFGKQIFDLMGLTLDSFRIGAGSILFITAVSLMGDKVKKAGDQQSEADSDNISVVPLAIPFAIGPGTIGTIMVMSNDNQTLEQHLSGCIGLTTAIVAVGVILLSSSFIERLIGRQGIKVLSKLTGLILAGIAAQIIFTGIKNFLNL